MLPAGTTAHASRHSTTTSGGFEEAVIAGLSKSRKALPSRFFYDAAGSALFEEITRLPEYYPTRTEAGILAAHAGEMIDGLADNGVMIEFGSGSSLKTELLLAAAPRGIAYVPVDVSAAALADATQRLEARFPDLDVRPLLGDFSGVVRLPADLQSRPKLGFFPGSTIGNFMPADAVALLRSFAEMLAGDGRLIIGVDLKKDARTLVAAYNDAAGVTAAFNLNLLARINRELEAAIDLESFQHRAIYDPRQGRIEMHLVSRAVQEIRVSGRRFRFEAGESIHTENSYKYALGEFQEIARAAGWQPMRVWTDADALFSVHELALPSA